MFQAIIKKELIVHDWLTERISYDTENSSKNPLSFTAYGGMVFKENSANASAVCEGYAKAFLYILNRLGINSVLISGTYDGVAHMWNAVQLNGEWYNVDITANDSEDKLTHTFFNVTDKAILKTHKKDKDFYKSKIEEIEKGNYNLFAPSCTANTYNYFYVNKTTISKKENVYSIIAEQIIKNTEKNSMEFSFSDNTDLFYKLENIFEIIEPEKIEETVLKETGKEISVSVWGIENSKAFVIEW